MAARHLQLLVQPWGTVFHILSVIQTSLKLFCLHGARSLNPVAVTAICAVQIDVDVGI